MICGHTSDPTVLGFGFDGLGEGLGEAGLDHLLGLVAGAVVEFGEGGDVIEEDVDSFLFILVDEDFLAERVEAEAGEFGHGFTAGGGAAEEEEGGGIDLCALGFGVLLEVDFTEPDGIGLGFDGGAEAFEGFGEGEFGLDFDDAVVGGEALGVGG